VTNCHYLITSKWSVTKILQPHISGMTNYKRASPEKDVTCSIPPPSVLIFSLPPVSRLPDNNLSLTTYWWQVNHSFLYFRMLFLLHSRHAGEVLHSWQWQSSYTLLTTVWQTTRTSRKKTVAKLHQVSSWSTAFGEENGI